MLKGDVLDPPPESGSPPAPRWRLATILLAGITFYYAVVGLLVLPLVVYSGDIGVKYVQAQALVDNRFRHLDIPYRGEFLDPNRQFCA